MQEEGWVVCRAFKKRAMHPPRGVAGAWDPSYPYYHDPVLAGAARFKQESPELDGGAASAASALLQYSSRLVELPQLDEDCGEHVMTTAATAFGAAPPFSFHDAATPAPWCDPVWIDDDCAGYAAAGHDDLFGLDGGDHGWAQSVPALLWNL